MASTRSLSQLFRALGSQDIRAASAFARAIAEDEERKGHKSAAALLRGALTRQGATNFQPAALLDVSTTLIPEKQGPPLSSIVLPFSARQQLSELKAEWDYRFALTEEGLPRRSKLLFSGPPGCGKTLTARSLGTELGLPVLTVRFSSLVGAYLGQTGANLRAVFAFAENNPCILLLDEFDAIGRRRGRSTDVGELDRIVISLLQELDHTAPRGLVIAATNEPTAVDHAIWRRFDVHVDFPRPSRRVLERFYRMRAKELGESALSLPKGVSNFADAEKVILTVHRRSVLQKFSNSNGSR